MADWHSIWRSGVLDKLKGSATTSNELAEMISIRLGESISASNLRDGLRRLKRKYKGAPELQQLLAPAPPRTASEILDEHRRRQDVKRKAAEYQQIIEQLHEAERRLNHVLQISSFTPPSPIKSRPKKDGRPNVTAIALASDWHVEERIDSAMVNGRNEYNPDIARRRATRYFDGLIWLLEHHRKSMDVDHLVLALLGDFITGYIHEELEESNYLSPVEASLLAQELLVEGIERLLPMGIPLVVPCCRGNHGRTTAKRRLSTGSANSFEWLMYQHMAARYKGDSRITFHIADGDYVYLDVYDHRIGFTHGDNFNYQGGVGGHSIPILRGVARLQTYEPTDIVCMGHHHSQADFGAAMVNGSLIGYSPYAVAKNLAYQEPMQTFFLVHPRRGKDAVSPIWVES